MSCPCACFDSNVPVVSLLLLLLQLGEYAEALEDYQAALTLDPSSSYAHYNCGIVLDRLGEFASAVACFSAAIQLEPQNADFYHVRLGSA